MLCKLCEHCSLADSTQSVVPPSPPCGYAWGHEEQAIKGYGQFCPVAKAAQLFRERWTALILRDLAAGLTRFSDLHRGVALMSPTLLSRRLKQLEAEGVIGRRRDAASRGHTYHLTEAGREFAPVV